ncbi:hypothetical protein FAGKG844_20255 [Frankia sp. AgKG'84/4]
MHRHPPVCRGTDEDSARRSRTDWRSAWAVATKAILAGYPPALRKFGVTLADGSVVCTGFCAC